MASKSCANAQRQPYMRPLFYSQPEHQFWRDPNRYISPAGVEYYNELVAEWEKSKKVLPVINVK